GRNTGPQHPQVPGPRHPGRHRRGPAGEKLPETPRLVQLTSRSTQLRPPARFHQLSWRRAGRAGQLTWRSFKRAELSLYQTLPDVIAHNLDILIIGINPGLLSAYRGHHYPNPGNHFWKCLFLSGLTDKQLNYLHDQSLPETNGIGFTNMVERTTPGSKDLCSKEIREGGRQLLAKLQKYKPLIAAFNGKGIFCKETFGVKAKNLEFGLQPYKIPQTETVCYLMPSSSPRCAQFPRAQDKVHFYIKLKELRDQMRGQAPSRDVQETDYTFDLQLAKEDAKRVAIKEEQEDPEYDIVSYGGEAEWISPRCLPRVPSSVVSLPPQQPVDTGV
uniref:G/T mismatch-specific thymine DNA glycosylase n=1 Tax=Mola mola TaxID=94237 RepID=A0A3Q4BXA4_MOLML